MHHKLNPLNAELNPTCHLLALLAHHILHVSGVRVNHSSRLFSPFNFHIPVCQVNLLHIYF